MPCCVSRNAVVTMSTAVLIMSTPVLNPKVKNNEPVLVSTPVLNSQHARAYHGEANESEMGHGRAALCMVVQCCVSTNVLPMSTPVLGG